MTRRTRLPRAPGRPDDRPGVTQRTAARLSTLGSRVRRRRRDQPERAAISGGRCLSHRGQAVRRGGPHRHLAGTSHHGGQLLVAGLDTNLADRQPREGMVAQVIHTNTGSERERWMSENLGDHRDPIRTRTTGCPPRYPEQCGRENVPS